MNVFGKLLKKNTKQQGGLMPGAWRQKLLLSLVLASVLSCKPARYVPRDTCDCPTYGKQLMEHNKKLNEINEAIKQHMDTYASLLGFALAGDPEWEAFVRAEEIHLNIEGEGRQAAYQEWFNEGINLSSIYFPGSSYQSPFWRLNAGEVNGDPNALCDLESLKQAHDEVVANTVALNLLNEQRKQQYDSGAYRDPIACKINCQAVDEETIRDYKRTSSYDAFQNFSFEKIFTLYDLWVVLDNRTRTAEEEQLFMLMTEGFMAFFHNLTVLAQEIGLDDVGSYDDLDPVIVDLYAQVGSVVDKDSISQSMDSVRNLFGEHGTLIYGGPYRVYNPGEGGSYLPPKLNFPDGIAPELKDKHEQLLDQSKPRVEWGNVLDGTYVRRLETPGCPLTFTISITGSIHQGLTPINNQMIIEDVGQFEAGEETRLNQTIFEFLQTFRARNPNIEVIDLVIGSFVGAEQVSSLKKEVPR